MECSENGVRKECTKADSKVFSVVMLMMYKICHPSN